MDARKFTKPRDAEIDTPPELEGAAFVRGRLLGLTAAQRLALLRRRNLRLAIEGRSYRVVSLKESGAFIAVKEE
jgi:hypothetical protein